VAEGPPGPPPDYANPGGPVPAATVPASKASIGVIASLHAVVTLELLDGLAAAPAGQPLHDPGPADFTSLLFTLQRVPGVFEGAYRPYRFRIPKSEACLICSAIPAPAAGEDLDVALDQALARLGNE
jgi:hypothetical protein